ncbi:hypothetical protein B6D60_00290 [candidate division KSB1 bacterium 4484_87]|nr:MAG: hypothetical protein B6D60_00290 [candidate division KSB1 bacterium 4484_87]
MNQMKKIFLFTILLLGSCSIHEKEVLQPSDSRLQLIQAHRMEVTEPSGLSLDKSRQFLWTVNDPPSNQVYKIDLTGKIIETLTYSGDDLEGVTCDISEDALWIAEESKREIVKISFTGEELERHPIAISGNSKNGLEGITMTRDGEIWLVNEKDPGELIQLTSDFSIKYQFVLSVATDYSGICADTTDGRFWVVSDESQLLFLWDKKNGVIEQYSLPFKKAEGIAVDFDNDLFYIVSDSEQKLYVFKIAN